MKLLFLATMTMMTTTMMKFVDATFPSCTDQELIVQLHNKWRKDVAGAKNIIKMRYNQSVADQALLWTKLCEFKHQELDSPLGRVGQNLYASSDAEVNWNNVISSWGGEKADFIYHEFNQDDASMYCKPGKDCGHYTQLVWAGSYEVGCAFAKCPSLTYKDQQITNGWAVACDYLPAGNKDGEFPYFTVGNCPEGFQRSDSSLCTNEYTDNSTCKVDDTTVDNSSTQTIPSYLVMVILSVGGFTLY